MIFPFPLKTENAKFETPEAVLVRSSEGLGGLSREMHRLFLDRLLPKTWADDNPPVLLNSWEARYFNVDNDSILEMAKQVGRILWGYDPNW